MKHNTYNESYHLTLQKFGNSERPHVKPSCQRSSNTANFQFTNLTTLHTLFFIIGRELEGGEFGTLSALKSWPCKMCMRKSRYHLAVVLSLIRQTRKERT